MYTTSTITRRITLIIALLIGASLFPQLSVAGSYSVIVNAKNKIADAKGRKHVKRLFLKQQSNWPDGTQCRPFDRGPESIEHKMFIKKVLKMSESELASHWMSLKQRSGETPPRAVTSSRMLVRLVGKYEGAIGVVDSETAKTLPGGVRILFS